MKQEFIDYLSKANFPKKKMAIINQYNSGVDELKIADDLDISPQRVKGVCRQFDRMLRTYSYNPSRYPDSDLWELGITWKTYRKLIHHDIKSIAQLEAFIEDGTQRLLDVAGIGAIAAFEIIDGLLDYHRKQKR